MPRVWTPANQVTLARIGLVLALPLLVYTSTPLARFAAAGLAVLIICMDGLDGHLARRRGEATALGSMLDIAGDRIVENVFWIVLAHIRLIPVWIPLVILARGILTDSLRSYAFRYGYTAFGARSLHRLPLSRFLTGHPVMRTGYAVLKGVTFALLLLASAFRLATPAPAAWAAGLARAGLAAAVGTAILCLVRGIPVFVEGYRFLQTHAEA